MARTFALGPRVSKEEFMAALHLEANHPCHELYYRAMRDETVAIYNIINQDTANLVDSVRDDPDAKPPFFWHHIRPEVQKWGIREIWMRASPLTRPFFELGTTTGEYGPNWVTGWLLYSVFRSRDIRNNRSRRRNMHSGVHAGDPGVTANHNNEDNTLHTMNPSPRVLQPLAGNTSAQPGTSMSSKLDTLNTTMTTTEVITPTASTEGEESPRASKSTTTFYDPVRNGILTYHHS